MRVGGWYTDPAGVTLSDICVELLRLRVYLDPGEKSS